MIIVKVHSEDPNIDSRSWDALDEKFGRIIAQQVAVTWEYDEKGVSESHRGQKIPYGKTISDLFLSTNYTLDFTGNETDTYLALESCEGDQHFINVPPETKKDFI